MLDSDPMGYWESPALKARIAKHYKDKYGVDVAPNRITLTCGASPALVLALASSFNPGDRVALARPGYVAYRNTLKALHIEPVELACGANERYQLSAERIAALDPAPAGVIIASPANPTGVVTDAGAIVDLAGRHPQSLFLVDEAFADFVPGFTSLAGEDRPHNVAVLLSLTKSFAVPGLRLIRPLFKQAARIGLLPPAVRGLSLRLYRAALYAEAI